MKNRTKEYDEDIKKLSEPYKMPMTITPTPNNIRDTVKSKQSQTPTPYQLQKTFEIYKVKQRMINFTLKTFNKVDVKNILEFWLSNIYYVITIENSKLYKSQRKKVIKDKNNDDLEGRNKNAFDEEIFKKKENSTNIKTEFKLPDKDIEDLIPFCTNIFTITKNDN